MPGHFAGHATIKSKRLRRCIQPFQQPFRHVIVSRHRSLLRSPPPLIFRCNIARALSASRRSLSMSSSAQTCHNALASQSRIVSGAPNLPGPASPARSIAGRWTPAIPRFPLTVAAISGCCDSFSAATGQMRHILPQNTFSARLAKTLSRPCARDYSGALPAAASFCSVGLPSSTASRAYANSSNACRPLGSTS